MPAMEDEKEERLAASADDVTKDAPPSRVRRRSLVPKLEEAAPAAAPAPVPTGPAVALKATSIVAESHVEKAEQREGESQCEATKDMPSSRRRLSSVSTAVIAASGLADAGMAADSPLRATNEPSPSTSRTARPRRESVANSIDALGQVCNPRSVCL